MMKKFKFLTRESIKSKINTKAFKLINLALFIIIVALINLDSIVKLFGGDFDELVHIYVIDEVGVYDDFKQIIDNSYLDVLENYNAEIEEATKPLEELEKEIKDDEKKDIIINIKEVENLTYDNVFDVDFISYEYVDTILYQDIVNAINTVKISRAMSLANIDESILSSVYKGAEINRIVLNEDVKENEEFMELIGSAITLIFVVPFFILILLIVQMIGAEINDEKSTRSMEIIISNVSPKMHFASKIIASTCFVYSESI